MKEIRFFRILGMLILVVFCQSFQCGDEKWDETGVYIGGIVKDAITQQPLSGILIQVNKEDGKALTNTKGKFGFYASCKDMYRIYIGEPIQDKNVKYNSIDTLIFRETSKILLDISLKKKQK